MWIDQVRQFFKLTPLQLIALTARAEAGIEGRNGMQAVINVIHNRRLHPLSRFADSSLIEGSSDILDETQSPYHAIILGKRQFSCFLSGYNNIVSQYTAETFEGYARNNSMLKTAVELCESLRTGKLVDITGGADHYYAVYIKRPDWTSGMIYRTRIGLHEFWSEPPHYWQSPQVYHPEKDWAGVGATPPGALPVVGIGGVVLTQL